MISFTTASGEKKKGCFKCGDEGHMRGDCPLNGGGGDRKNGCFKCGDMGHMKSECPIVVGGGGGSYEMMVPGSKVGLIIGKGGEIIKQLMEETGAKMNIMQETIEEKTGEKRYVKTDEKSLRITGREDKVQHAVEKVMEILNQNDEHRDGGGRGGTGRGGGRGGSAGVGRGGSGKQSSGGNANKTQLPVLDAEQEKLLQKTIKNARSVLLPNREGLLSDEFEKEFRGHFGFPVPYERLGFINTMELIEYQMTDVVDVERLPSGHILLKGIPDKNTDHLSRMVKNQRQNLEGYNRRTAQLINQQGQGFRRKLDRNMVIEASREVPKSTKVVIQDLMAEHEDGLALVELFRVFNEMIGYKLEFRSLGFLNLPDFVYYGLGDTVDLILNDVGYGIEWIISPKHSSVAITTQSNQSNKANAESAVVDPTSDGQSKDMLFVPDLVSDQMKNEFKAILGLHSDGLTANQFSQEYQKLYGSKLEPHQFGFESVVEMCLWLPEVFQAMKEEDSGDWRFKTRQKKIHEGEKMLGKLNPRITQSNSVESLTKSIHVTEFIKSNIERIMLKYHHGLPCQKFRRAYLDTIGNNLDVRKIGFSNLELFLKSPDIKHLVELSSGAGSIVIMPGLEIVKPDRRKDVLGWQSELIQQGLPSDRRVGDSVEVIVTEVFNPNKFWIRLNGKTSKSLENLMDEMENFYYSEESKQLKIPDELVVVGLLCASLYIDGAWHRGCIKTIIDVDHVEVFFLDYGTAAKVRMDTLRYLHKKFGEVPRQAVEARLAEIKPVEGLLNFSKEASYRFLELVKSLPGAGRFIAEIKGLKPKLVLRLVDSHLGLGGLPINQVLVDEGLAEDDSSMKVNRQKDDRSPLRRPFIDRIIAKPSDNSAKNVSTGVKFKMETSAAWVESGNEPEYIQKLAHLK